jgi:hypothetical protein
MVSGAGRRTEDGISEFHSQQEEAQHLKNEGEF